MHFLTAGVFFITIILSGVKTSLFAKFFKVNSSLFLCLKPIKRHQMNKGLRCKSYSKDCYLVTSH